MGGPLSNIMDAYVSITASLSLTTQEDSVGLRVASNPHPSSASHHSILAHPVVKARDHIIPWELCSHIGGDLLPSVKNVPPTHCRAATLSGFL